MKLLIQFITRCLMPEQISVRTRFFPQAVCLFRMFSYRQCDRTLRICRPYLPDNLRQFLICIVRIFTPLQYKCPKSQLIAIGATIQYLFLCQTITFCISVTISNSAIITVVLAIVGKFNQSTSINICAIIFFLKPNCFLL